MENKNQKVTIENLPPLFDEKILAQALGKSEKWCQQARLRGSGPKYKKLDGSVRYTRGDTLIWIEESTRQSTSERSGIVCA